MANNDMRIIIGFDIDKNKEEIKIKKMLDDLSNEIGKLKLTIDIDKNVVSNFEKLSNSINNTTKFIQNDTKEVNKHTQAVKEAANAEAIWRVEQEKTSQVTGRKTTTLGNIYNNNKQVVKGTVDGGVLDVTDVKNPALDDKLANQIADGRIKAQEKFNKLQEEARKKEIDYIHQAANEENKARQEMEQAFLSMFKRREDERRIWDANQQAAIYKNGDLERTEITKNQKAEEDFLIRKQKLITQIADTQRRFAGDKSLVSNLDNLLGGTNQLSSVGNYKNKIAEVENQLKSYITTANSAHSHSISFSESLSTAFQKFPVWMIATSAFYAPLHALETGIAYVKQFDDALTSLVKVVDLSKSQIGEMTNSAITLGKELGKSSIDIMNAYAEFGRQFKTVEEIQSVTRSAVLASNVTTLSAADAAKSLTTAMISFGISAKDSMHIIDSMNEIQNNYRISAEDLADSLSKVGSMAKLAGSSMESLEGATTAIVSATGISGNEAGTALKGFISRIFRIGEEGEQDAGKSEKLLKSLGVEIRKSATEYKTFDEVLTEINSKWSSWGSITQQNVAQTIGSQYHVSKFIALMDNFKTGITATNTAINSQGSAMKENEKYLDSISGKWQILKTTVESKWNETISSDFIKTLISGTTLLIDRFGNLRTVTMTLASAALIWKGTQLTTWVKGLATSTSLLTDAEIANAIATKGLVAGWNSLKMAMATNPIGLIATGLTSLMLIMDVFGDKQKDQTEQMEELNKRYSEQSDQIKTAKSYYEENSKSLNTNSEIKAKLFEMQNKLIDTFGKEASGIDLVNGKYDEQIKKLESLNKKNMENDIKDSQIVVNSIKEDRYVDPVLTSGTVRGDKKYQVADMGKATLDIESYYKKLLDVQNKLRDGNTDIFIGANKIPKSATEWNNALSAVQKAINDIKPELDKINELENKKKELIRSSTVEQEKFNKQQQDMFDKINTAVSSQPVDKYSKDIQIVATTIKSLDGKNLNEVVAKLKEIPQIKGDSSLLDSLSKLSAVSNDSSGTVETLEMRMSNLKQEFIDTAKEVEPYNKLIQELKDGKKMTADEVAELAVKEQGFMDAITIENGQIKVNIEAVEKLRDAKMNSINDEVSGMKNLLIAKKEATINMLKMYGAEYDSIEKINAAKQQYYETEGDNSHSAKAIDQAVKDVSDFDAQIKKIEELGVTTKKGLQTVGLSEPKKDSASKQDTKESPLQETDFTNELIKSYNALYDARQKNIDLLDQQIKLAERQKDEPKQIELLTQKLNEQKASVQDLVAANQKLRSGADDIRKKYSELGSQFSKNSINFDAWFNGTNASQDYISYIEGLESQYKKIYGDGINLTDQQKIQLKTLKEQIDTGKQIFSQIQNFKQGYVSNTEAIKQQNEAILQSEDTLASTQTNAIEQRRKLATEVIDTIKKTYEAQKNAELDDLDKSVQAYKDATQAKIDEIDRLRAAQDYNSNLSKDQQKLQEIQNQINAYSLDDSNEAKSKVIELKKQLADQQEKIQKEQQDYSDKLVKEDLQNKQKAYEDDVKHQKDAVTEKYDNLINDDQKYLKIENDIISGHVSDIQNTMKGLIDSLGSYAITSAGKVSKYASEIKSLMSSLNTGSTALGTLSPMDAGNYSPHDATEEQIISSMKVNSQAWRSASDDQKKKLEETNQRLGKQIGATYESKTGIWYKAGLRLYHNGGEVGGSSLPEWLKNKLNLGSNEVAAILKKGEVVLDQPANFLSNFAKRLIPDFSSIISKSPASSPPINNINLNLGGITISGDRAGGNEALSIITNGLKKMGVNINRV